MRSSLLIVALCALSAPLVAYSANCGDLPTQSAMNQCAQNEYQAADKALNTRYRAYRGRLDAPLKARLTAVQRAWIQFRDLSCDFESAGVEGGSVSPFIRSSCLADMTRARTRQIERLASCAEGDLDCPTLK